jgi:hypothetical protein
LPVSAIVGILPAFSNRRMKSVAQAMIDTLFQIFVTGATVAGTGVFKQAGVELLKRILRVRAHCPACSSGNSHLDIGSPAANYLHCHRCGTASDQYTNATIHTQRKNGAVLVARLSPPEWESWGGPSERPFSPECTLEVVDGREESLVASITLSREFGPLFHQSNIKVKTRGVRHSQGIGWSIPPRVFPHTLDRFVVDLRVMNIHGDQLHAQHIVSAGLISRHQSRHPSWVGLSPQAVHSVIRRQRMRKWSVVAFIVCVGVVACTQDPPEWNAFAHANATSTANDAAKHPTVDELDIYLDTSKSIQGYVLAGSNSVYGITLRELRNVASLLDRPVRTVVRSVDANVGPAVGDVELSRASTDSKLYGGNETNLAQAIGQFGQPRVVEASATGKAAGVALFNVLVTDGVQSMGGGVDEANCDSGSDQVCVRAQLSRWLRAGWAGVIIGIRSEFNGSIYSEINHSKHGGPYKIAYASDSSTPSTMRPFYLYALSPNAQALTDFTEKLKRRLKTAAPGIILRELPLNLPFSSGAAAARVLTSPTGQIISIEGGRETPVDRITVRFDARDARESAADSIRLRIHVPWSANALDMGSARELGRLVAWNAQQIDRKEKAPTSGSRVPEIRTGEPVVTPDGSIEVPITPVWPAGTGTRSWAVYALRGVIKMDEDTPNWIREWSTDLDTKPEYGNRTLFLENGALGIWRSRGSAPEEVAEILIRIGP